MRAKSLKIIVFESRIFDGTRFRLSTLFRRQKVVLEWEVAMPGSANECEAYARDCVRLAEHPNAPPEVRDRLLEMARMWMEAAMDEEKRGAGFMPPSPSDSSHEPHDVGHLG
jgi:hypothetical protein